MINGEININKIKIKNLYTMQLLYIHNLFCVFKLKFVMSNY